MFSYTLASSLLLGVTLGDCNYAIWNDALPLVTDTCYSCDGDDCGGLVGVMAACNATNTGASITYYLDTACTSALLVEPASVFNCGASGSCGSVEASATVYGSSDCSGNSTGVIAVDLAPDVCKLDESVGKYLGVEADASSIVVGYYSNSSCTVGTVVGIFYDNACVPDTIGEGFVLSLSTSSPTASPTPEPSDSSTLNIGVFTFVSAIAGIMAVLFY